MGEQTGTLVASTGKICHTIAHSLRTSLKRFGSRMNQLQNNRCVTCGAELRAGSRFCVQCGAKHIAFGNVREDAPTRFSIKGYPDGDSHQCPNCGKVPLQPTGKYCRGCGHAFSARGVAAAAVSAISGTAPKARHVRTPGDNPLGTFARSAGRAADVAAAVLAVALLTGA